MRSSKVAAGLALAPRAVTAVNSAHAIANGGRVPHSMDGADDVGLEECLMLLPKTPRLQLSPVRTSVR